MCVSVRFSPLVFAQRAHSSQVSAIHMDSRLRGNDGNNAGNVIPAKAGIHAALSEHE